MGLFSRLTAGIRARSRGMAGDLNTKDYPGRSYLEVRSRAGEVIGSHKILLGELKKQTGLLDMCLGKLDFRPGGLSGTCATGRHPRHCTARC